LCLKGDRSEEKGEGGAARVATLRGGEGFVGKIVLREKLSLTSKEKENQKMAKRRVTVRIKWGGCSGDNFLKEGGIDKNRKNSGAKTVERALSGCVGILTLTRKRGGVNCETGGKGLRGSGGKVLVYRGAW